MKLDLEKDVNNSNNTEFWKTSLGKGINSVIDTGIRAILPDFIEDIAINLKNNILQGGLKEIIDNITKNLSKSNKNNKEKIIKEDGKLQNLVSDSLNYCIQTLSKKKVIDSKTAKLLKQGKDVLMESLASGLSRKIKQAIKGVEKVENHVDKWTNFYEKQDIDSMKKEYKQLKKDYNIILPIEELINKVKIIEQIHEMVDNTKSKFDFNRPNLELANLFV